MKIELSAGIALQDVTNPTARCSCLCLASEVWWVLAFSKKSGRQLLY